MPEEKKKKTSLEQDEEYYTYMTRKASMNSLNTEKSKFETEVFEGINTRKSVFDRGAVFHTDKS